VKAIVEPLKQALNVDFGVRAGWQIKAVFGSLSLQIRLHCFNWAGLSANASFADKPRRKRSGSFMIAVRNLAMLVLRFEPIVND